MAEIAERAGFATGTRSLFWLVVRLSMLTVLTLGLYRFWMTTQLRQYYWGAVRVGGDPLEYSGTGWEKIQGFFVAVIVLAVYLAAVNLLLTFVGLSVFEGNPIALQISVVGTLPAYYYATYKNYGYLLARTRWRGIRFGLEPGAWGYVGRAMVLSLLVIGTAGLAYPYMHFKLAKYITDRSRYGDQMFQQGGKWSGLILVWLAVFAVLLVAAAAIFIIIFRQRRYGGDETTAILGLLVILTVMGFALSWVGQCYSACAHRLLWRDRRLGGSGFDCDLNLASAARVTFVGGLATVAATAVLSALLLSALDLARGDPPDLWWRSFWAGFYTEIEGQEGPPPSQFDEIVTILSLYIWSLLVYVPLAQVFVVRPMARLQVRAVGLPAEVIQGTAHQRPRDVAAEGGGFAEAMGMATGI